MPSSSQNSPMRPTRPWPPRASQTACSSPKRSISSGSWSHQPVANRRCALRRPRRRCRHRAARRRARGRAPRARAPSTARCSHRPRCTRRRGGPGQRRAGRAGVLRQRLLQPEDRARRGGSAKLGIGATLSPCGGRWHASNGPSHGRPAPGARRRSSVAGPGPPGVARQQPAQAATARLDVGRQGQQLGPELVGPCDSVRFGQGPPRPPVHRTPNSQASQPARMPSPRRR